MYFFGYNPEIIALDNTIPKDPIAAGSNGGRP